MRYFGGYKLVLKLTYKWDDNYLEYNIPIINHSEKILNVPVRMSSCCGHIFDGLGCGKVAEYEFFTSFYLSVVDFDLKPLFIVLSDPKLVCCLMSVFFIKVSCTTSTIFNDSIS